MEITFECRNCGQQLKTDTSLAGSGLPCPKCGSQLQVPTQKATDANRGITPSPVQDEPRRYSAKQMIIGGVAIVVIAASLWVVWQNAHPQKTTVLGNARLASPAKPKSDWTVTDYRVWAEPVLWDENSRVWAPSRGSGATTGARGSRAAVRVSVELAAVGGASVPGLWPGATRVELWRSSQERNGYALVQALETADAVTPIPSIEPQRQANDPAPRHYAYWLADTGAEPGRRYFYKIRYVGPWKKLLAETGYCSTVVVGVPAIDQAVDAEGHPRLSWAVANAGTNEFLTPPRLIIHSAGNQELARLPWGDGQFSVPLKIAGKATTYTVTLLARLRGDEWRLQGGQTSRTVAVEQEKRIEFSASSVPQPVAGAASIVSISVVPAGPRSGWYTLDQAGPDSGAYGVLWGGPANPKPSFERRSAQAGRAGLSGYGGWLHYSESPGLSERCVYTYTWEAPASKAPRSAQVWAVRSPLPTGLFAVAGNRQVHLRWDKLVYAPDDWVEGPFFVLKRTDEKQAGQDQGKLQLAAGEEVFRGSAETTEHLDTGVKNGQVYFYTLVIEGVTRATSWRSDIGEYACHVPVLVRMRPGFSGYPVMALPAVKRPLRVTLLSDTTDDPLVNATQAYTLRVLKKLNWVELVERALAPALLEENQLGEMRADSVTPGEEGWKRATSADLVLRFRRRQAGYESYVDVWVEDFKNSLRERFLTRPAKQVVLDQFAENVLQEISQRYAAAAGPLPPHNSNSCSLIHTIAVMGFVPISGATISEGGVEDLLTTGLSQEQCLEIVDRERIRALIREQGLTGLIDQPAALRLGKLLKADAIVTGFYGIDEKRIAISARLIDIETGNLIRIVDLEGSTEQIQGLGKQLALEISTATKLGTQGGESSLLRQLEAGTYASNPDKLAGAKTAAFVSPETPEHHSKIGTQYREQGQPEDALASFYTGLKFAEKKGDPWPFYLVIGEILHDLKRTEEAERLWARAVIDRERRRADADAANLNLAECRLQLKHPEEALAALSKIRGSSYRLGHAYESLGREAEALQAYAATLAPPGAQWSEKVRLGPSYAALIRRLDSAPAADRAKLLRLLVEKVRAARPYQALKALDELLAGQPDNLELQQFVVEVATAVGDHQRAQVVLQRIAEKHPNTVEGLRSMHQLASGARRQGDSAKAQEYLEAISQNQAAGPEADSLRERATLTLRTWKTVGTPAPRKPQPSSEEIGPELEGLTYSVTEVGTVYCREAESKRELWHYELRPRLPYQAAQARWSGNSQTLAKPRSGPALSNLALLSDTIVIDRDLVFVSNLIDGTVHVLDKNTGQRRWLFTDWSPLSPALVVGDKVYLGNSFGDLLVLTRDTGQLLKRVSCPAERESEYNERIYFLRQSETTLQFVTIEQYQTKKTIDRYNLMVSHTVSLADFQMAIAVTPSQPMDTTDRLLDSIRHLESPAPGQYVSARYWKIVELRTRANREKVIPALSELVADVRLSPQERALALGILTEFTGKAARPQVVEYLRHRLPALRAKAVHSLGVIGSAADVPLIRQALADVQIDVRRQAAQVLVAWEGLAATAALQKFLDDPNSTLRSDAAAHLYLAGNSSLKSVVMEYASDRDFEHNNDPTLLFIARCKAGDPIALAELEKRMGEDSNLRHWQEVTAKLIGRYYPAPDMIPFLGKRLKAAKAEPGGINRVPAELMNALANIGSPAAIPWLVDVLSTSPESAQPNPVSTALESLTGQAFSSDQGRWLLWCHTRGQSTVAETPSTVFTIPADKKGTDAAPLRTAAKQGDLAQVSKLLESGLRINDGDYDGRTALYFAAEAGHENVVRFLLEHGASLDSRKKYFQDWGPTALLGALYARQTEITELLLAKGARLETRDRIGNTPLLIAANTGNQAMIELLLARHADVQARNDQGWTALMFAAQSGQTELVQKFIDLGVPVDAQDGWGWTALASAAYRGHEEIAKVLLAKGANPAQALEILEDPQSQANPSGSKFLRQLVNPRESKD